MDIIQKMINVIIYLYQHTTPPFCLQTAGVYQSHRSVSAISFEKNRTCSIYIIRFLSLVLHHL